ncbi:hypothetical protein GII33_09510 [Gordonia pseudamarae]|uniref:Toxin-antitoxin system HicB family antitoxin n=1 Tax=Gordonia pseudamarae TaxID=2831662 RepID=A0ABX6IGU6_9ACTN|nr:MULTISPECIES: hypothetical protein [Gordonia]MBD0020983.1 hypothetical protein [Gordonia sp. (in: high G+C Gram-positive bacteria)]QHN26173.1 hypothetical protein GII33_09510 [Gordonia pseudamarae]QHN35067.1 hypothetical protein GII31_09305 [Gordonia pseudamarae]
MSSGSADSGRPDEPPDKGEHRAVRKSVPLRIDPAVYEALARWAADDLRSVNAQIEVLLRRALDAAGRTPRQAAPIRRRGRPRREM